MKQMMAFVGAVRFFAGLLLIVSVSSLPGSVIVAPADAQMNRMNAEQRIAPIAPRNFLPRLSTGCTNATLNGIYGFQRNGQTTSSLASGSQGPLTAIGIATFDGQGHVASVQTSAASGTFTFGKDRIDSYNINPDCTGTATLGTDTSGALFAQFVIVHNGSEVLGMSMTPGNNVAIHYERIADPQ